MPIERNLSGQPYYDDFSELNDFYKILFKPSVPVQVREMNQLQTIFQMQMERLGNNLYKRGTILDGCNFIYHRNYQFVKINDAQIDGSAVTPANYVGYFAKEASTNLVAQVINYQDGFETTDPDLKTLYLRYINSGNDGNTTAFSQNSALTIYDYENSIHKIEINNGGLTFSNSDAIVIVPALAVNVQSSNAFSNGETITATGKQAVIIGIDTTSYSDKTILKIKPVLTDLSNSSIANTKWQFAEDTTITGATSNASATILEVIGEDATATLTTDGSTGKIDTVTVTDRGSGYYVVPYVSVKCSGATTPDYTDLDLEAYNFAAQVRVSNTTGSVGNGYAFSVTDGIIWQKGYPARVAGQTVIVSKYDPQPDGLSVIFDVVEEIVDSNEDTSLLDNVTGSESEFAPGADRLKLVPELSVVNTSAITANDEMFALVDFVGGFPFREKRRTQFNSIEDELALRTYETSGNFVLDQFLVGTKSAANQSDEGRYFSVVVDPGKAYIDGKRVETLTNFNLKVEKGTDRLVTNNMVSSIDYGNYVRVNELSGVFQFNTGDTVKLYDTAKGYLSNTTVVNDGNTDPVGTQIGTARIRSLVHEDGDLGTNTAIYRLHLFNISMNATKNFRDVRAIYYDGTKKGIADIITETDTSTNTSICRLYQGSDKLLFLTGADSTQNITELDYVYRTLNNDLSLSNTGTLTKSISATPNHYFNYNVPTYGALTADQKATLVMTPTSNNIVMLDLTGTVDVNTGANTVTGTGTNFVTSLRVGDYVALWQNSTHYHIRKVTGITNATYAVVDSNLGFTRNGGTIALAYPKNIPVPLDRISGATANVNGSGDTLTINLGSNVNSTAAINVSLSYDILVVNATPQAKTANRNRFVKISLGNNENLTTGPWCLGVPDVFRLRNVYLSNASTVNTNSTNVTKQFYIDHNQTPNYLDLGYLYKDPKSGLEVDANTWLLVEYDAFTSSPGVFTITSYVSSNVTTRYSVDSTALSSLGSNVHSLEIPEVYTYNGNYYDLINCIDFRPVAANTVALESNSAAAPVNPSSTLSFGNTADISNDKKFPLPESSVNFNLTQFLGRKDIVILTPDNQIEVLTGPSSVDSSSYLDPTIPDRTIVLNKLKVPAYPTLPEIWSQNTYAILDRRIANERYSIDRILGRTVSRELSAAQINISQPSGYTMEDIGNLERRIADLEYYVSLNLLETDLKNRIIPSSISPSINRFKYGFFADDYTTTRFSDLENPEYQAEVVGGVAVPKSSSIRCGHGNTDFIIDYVEEYPIVSQNTASVPANTSSNGTTNTTPNTVFSYVERIQPNRNVGRANATHADTLNLTMASNSGLVTIRFYNYTRGDKITVYKNNVAIISTANAVALSNTDVSQMKAMSLFAPVKDNLTTTLRTQAGANAGWDVIYGGKITFTHNPSDGRDYKIVTEKGTGSAIWRYRVDFPVDSYTTSPTIAPTTNTNIISYIGSVVAMNPNYLSASALQTSFGMYNYRFQGSPVNIELRGLRPNTLHKVYIDGIDVSGWARNNNDSPVTNYPTSIVTQMQTLVTAWQAANSATIVAPQTIYNPLISDSYGRLSFTLYLTNSEDRNLYDILNSTLFATGSTVTNKKILIKSLDENSYADVNIQAKLIFNNPISNIQDGAPNNSISATPLSMFSIKDNF